MHGVSAEVTQDAGMLFHHRDFYAATGQKQAKANSVSPVDAFLNWWDGNELWLSGLAFVLQAMLVMPVVLVVAYITAALLDGLLGKGIALMRHARHADEAPA